MPKNPPSLGLVLAALLIFGLGWGLTRRTSAGRGLHEKTTRIIPATPITPKHEIETGDGHGRQGATQHPTKDSFRSRPWAPGFLSSLGGAVKGDKIQVELVGGRFATGHITLLQRTNGDTVYVAGNLDQPQRGAFFFQKQTIAGKAGDFVGVVQFSGSEWAYRIEPSGPDNSPELLERPVEQVVCANLPPPVGPITNTPEAGPQVEPGNYPDVPIPPYQNGIAVLESLHGAPAVIYLDFQGGYTPTWGGVTYDRPNLSNDQIRDVWRRVVEDFMPFTINVTTDLGVFQHAAEGSRQRVIITPTTIAAPGEGGAAYTGSFNWTGDTPCWVFETSGKFCAEACSHEAGHTLGLTHDGYQIGNVLYEYYSGQGTGDTSWAPIMGLPYYANVTQWSRGEYLYADNPQDQLALIVAGNNNLGYRPDDTGDTLATSRYLDVYGDYSASAEGIIERSGDVDAFQFTTSGGYFSLLAQPVSVSPNLALQVALYDAADNLLMSSNPQDTLWASLSTNLSSGTYTFRVAGASRNDPLTNGFSNYGSLGYYSITGRVSAARLPQRFDLPEYGTNGTIIGTVTNSSGTTDTLSYNIVSGNNSNTFGIGSSGILYLADHRPLDGYAFANGNQFPVQFELFIDITDPENPGLTETNCRVLVNLTYVPRPPLIELQPISLDVLAGTNAHFDVQASGDAPLIYQWFFEGLPITNQNASSLTLRNVQTGDEGDYGVVIANALGSATSAVARLVVQPTVPIITRPPESHGVFPGFGVEFDAVAEGTVPLGYQWQFNGANITGATTSSLTITSAQSLNAGLYRVVISNQIGSATSPVAQLVIIPVAAWGADSYGQTNLPIDLTNVVEIASGANHGLALRRDGAVISWGNPVSQTNFPSALSNIVAIAAGGNHSLALTREGAVVAWGDNSVAQTNAPDDLSNVVAIAAGGNHSLALCSDGLVRAWGGNSQGQAIVPSTVTNIVAIAAGSEHSLALGADGTVYGWGADTFGQSHVPTNVIGVMSIAAGGDHSLALLSNRTVVAWGDNQYGESTVPLGLSNITAIAAGSFHSVALDGLGRMFAWGAGVTNFNNYPEMGQCIIPLIVSNITAASAGESYTLALAGDGAPYVTEPPIGRMTYSGAPVTFRAAATGLLPLSFQWQFNGTNIPGATARIFTIANAFTNNAGDYRVIVTNSLGVAVSASAPLRFHDSPPVLAVQPLSSQLLLGSRAVLQALAYGSQPLFYQWRLNGMDLPGETQSTLTLDRLQLSQAGDYYVMISNALGVATSAKARIRAVQVVAWGNNFSSQTNAPSGLARVVSVAGGTYHSLALKEDGTVSAWGALNQYNYGQCNVPADLTNAVAVAAGGFHSLALKADGTVVAWGAGASTGVINFGHDFGQSMVPSGLNNVIAIAAGQYTSVALKNDGRVVVWGSGQSLWTNILAPITNAVAISARDALFFLLRSDGSGIQNGFPSGPLTTSNTVAIAEGGNFTLVLNSSGKVASSGGPVVPPGLSNVVQIAAGQTHALALTGEGKTWTWGGNFSGLGQVPTGLVYAADIAAGETHSLLVAGDGSPVVKTQPVDQTAYAEGQAVLAATVGGVRPLSCQWRFNETDLVGATNISLRLSNLQMVQSGGYSLVASNLFGTATSRVARVTVLWNVGSALDAPNLLWKSSGDATWFGQTATTHDGQGAAQSGPIMDNQQCSIAAWVFGPGTLSFWWKVSSEQWFDFLTFSIDGVSQAAISGEIDWQREQLVVPPGGHVLTWTYAKDTSGSAGLDAAWLDQVSFVPNFPVILQDPLSQAVNVGAGVLLNADASGSPPLNYQWVKDGAILRGATSNSFTFIAATRSDSGAYSLVVSNGFGTVTSSDAIVRVRVSQKLSGFGRARNGTFALLSSDADGGMLLPGDLTNFVIQTSEDLQHWQTLTNPPTLSNGMLLIIDPATTNSPARFYRVLED